MSVSYFVSKQWLFAACLAGLTAALWAQPASAIVGGRIGGPLEDSAVMVLTDRGGVCTGVLVAPLAVLTAAHCVPQGAQLRVFHREQGEPVLSEPAAVARHPEFRAAAIRERTRSIDLALVRLAKPLSPRFAPAQLAASDGAANDVVLAGFGLSVEGQPKTTGTWRSVSLRVTEPHGPSRILLWARGEVGAGACQGDSGGPVIGKDGAVTAVISWSTGSGGRRCGALSQAAKLAPQRGWIDQTLAQWSQAAAWR